MDPFCHAISMLRPARQRLQHQHVQRPLHQMAFSFHSRSHNFLSHATRLETNAPDKFSHSHKPFRESRYTPKRLRGRFCFLPHEVSGWPLPGQALQKGLGSPDFHTLSRKLLFVYSSFFFTSLCPYFIISSPFQHASPASWSTFSRRPRMARANRPRHSRLSALPGAACRRRAFPEASSFHRRH